jgi:hypothetical protein
MRTSIVRPALLLLLSLTAVNELGADPRMQSSEQQTRVLSGAEFPDYDAEVLRQERNGLINNSLTARLKRKPGVPEIADLLEQNRVEVAIRLLRSIVKSSPQDIPRAFKVVVEKSSRFSDTARGYPELLQQLVDAAREQLPRLSREEAAQTERQLVLVDRRMPSNAFSVITASLSGRTSRSPMSIR